MEQLTHEEKVELCDILTPRQREVLGLMAKGLSHREIAARLGIGRRTVVKHMIAVYDRLRLERRSPIMAIVWAVLLGEIELE